MTTENQDLLMALDSAERDAQAGRYARAIDELADALVDRTTTLAKVRRDRDFLLACFRCFPELLRHLPAQHAEEVAQLLNDLEDPDH